jgi:hypothetical protein
VSLHLPAHRQRCNKNRAQHSYVACCSAEYFVVLATLSSSSRDAGLSCARKHTAAMHGSGVVRCVLSQLQMLG